MAMRSSTTRVVRTAMSGASQGFWFGVNEAGRVPGAGGAWGIWVAGIAGAGGISIPAGRIMTRVNSPGPEVTAGWAGWWLCCAMGTEKSPVAARFLGNSGGGGGGAASPPWLWPNWIVKSLGPRNGRSAGEAVGGASTPRSISSTGRGFAPRGLPNRRVNSPGCPGAAGLAGAACLSGGPNGGATWKAGKAEGGEGATGAGGAASTGVGTEPNWRVNSPIEEEGARGGSGAAGAAPNNLVNSPCAAGGAAAGL